MFEIPEHVYLQKPSFVRVEDETLLDLLGEKIPEDMLQYSIHSILVDSRVAELMGFAEATGRTFRDAVKMRIKQVQATIVKCAEDPTTELEDYLVFLKGL